MPKRIAILISGRGSNMEALIKAAIPETHIALVLSNKADAKGLETAKAHGIPTALLPHKGFATREEYDAALHAILFDHKIDAICLAGFMRILSAEFVNKWPNKILNIHPSLLPAYKGTDTHRRVIEAGEKHHGCSVHFVVPEMDAGPVILQASCPVMPDDTEQSLGERVLKLEHEIYPKALALFAGGKLQVTGNKVLVKE